MQFLSFFVLLLLQIEELSFLSLSLKYQDVGEVFFFIFINNRTPIMNVYFALTWVGLKIPDHHYILNWFQMYKGHGHEQNEKSHPQSIPARCWCTWNQVVIRQSNQHPQGSPNAQYMKFCWRWVDDASRESSVLLELWLADIMLTFLILQSLLQPTLMGESCSPAWRGTRTKLEGPFSQYSFIMYVWPLAVQTFLTQH